MSSYMQGTRRTADVYDANRENYFSIAWLVLSVCSGSDGRGQIVSKPKLLACVMIRYAALSPVDVGTP